MQTKFIILVSALIIMAFASVSFGQIVYDQPGSTSIKFFYSSWEIESIVSDTLLKTDDLTQSSSILSGFLPLRDNFEARYFVIGGANRLTTGATEQSQSGLGDARIQLSHSFDSDRLLFSVGVNLPTGKRELDEVDSLTIQFLSRDYLTVPLRRYGEGLGISLLAGGARQIGRFRCGLSAQYQINGKYTPYDNNIEYAPGNLFSFSANTHVIFDKINYAVDFVYSLHTAGQRNDIDVFKQAPQLDSRLTATFLDEPYTTSIGLKMVIRGRNTRNDVDGEILTQLRRYGNEFVAFVNVEYLTGINWHILAHIDTRKVWGGEEEYVSSSVFNFGLNVAKELSPHFGFDIGGSYNTGSTGDGLIDIRGFQITAGLTAAY